MPCVVIPYLQGPDNGAELRYTLRSIAKQMDAQTEVVLLGDCPVWASSIHIPCKDLKGSAGHVYRSTAHKMLVACLSDKVSEEFVWMADDMPFIAPVSMEELRVARSNVDLKAVVHWRRVNPTASDVWREAMKSTCARLKAKGRPLYGYETHGPRVFEKSKMIDVLSEMRMLEEPTHLSTMYYNSWKDAPDACKTSDFKLSVHTGWNAAALKEMMPGKKHLNWQQKLWGRELKAFMHAQYPNKCRFEI